MAKWIYEKWTQDEIIWEDIQGTHNPDGTFRRNDYFYIVNSNVTLGDIIRGYEYDKATVIMKAEHYDAFNSGKRATFYYLKKVEFGNYGDRILARQVRANKYDLQNALKKGHYLSTLTAEEGTYPDDGVHVDNFYYKKIKKAFPEIFVKTASGIKTASAMFVKTNAGIREVTDVYVKTSNGIKQAR